MWWALWTPLQEPGWRKALVCWQAAGSLVCACVVVPTAKDTETTEEMVLEWLDVDLPDVLCACWALASWMDDGLLCLGPCGGYEPHDGLMVDGLGRVLLTGLRALVGLLLFVVVSMV